MYTQKKKAENKTSRMFGGENVSQPLIFEMNDFLKH